MTMRFEYGQSAYLLLQIVDDHVAITTIYGVISVDMLIIMRADVIEETSDRCVIRDLSQCIITSTANEIDAIFGMAESGCSRDRSCAWVVSPEGSRAWRYLAARMANLGYPRRVFTSLSAATVWVQREALLPQF